jgi:hypothetical protein
VRLTSIQVRSGAIDQSSEKTVSAASAPNASSEEPPSSRSLRPCIRETATISALPMISPISTQVSDPRSDPPLAPNATAANAAPITTLAA